MALVDVTIVNVAMPTIGRYLNASGAALQLVVSGYTVSYAMLLITCARLGGLYGRRRMYLAGVIAFSVSSLLCGIAPDAGTLIAARFVQGAGAAAMIPQIITIIQERFEGRNRATALGGYSAVLAGGFAAGQVLGGVLVSADLFGAGWRPVFLVNVPLGLLVAALVPHMLPAEGLRVGTLPTRAHLWSTRRGKPLPRYAAHALTSQGSPSRCRPSAWSCCRSCWGGRRAGRRGHLPASP